MPGRYGVERLPWKTASALCSSGAFQLDWRLAAHCWKTSSTWVASQTPWTSTRPSARTSFSVPRIGPEVSTGEAIRTRVRDWPIAPAIRCASASPRPGQNHGRIGPGGALNAPDPSTRPRSHRSRKTCSNWLATAGSPSTRTIRFSSRVHESSVQLVEPVQTASPSRTTNLWCMRSGSPGIGFTGTPIAARMSGSVRGGGGSGSRRTPSAL